MVDSTSTPVTIIQDFRATVADPARLEGDDVWLPLEKVFLAAGWELKPQGMCRGETCVPLPSSQRDRLVRHEDSMTWFNLSEFARLIEQPVASDVQQRIWYFGPPGWDWKSRTAGNIASDFVAFDLADREHSLSEKLGKKVFLLFWASW